MEIKIGLQHVQREVVLETEATAEQVENDVRQAFAEGGVIALTDAKGRKVLVPADRIAYVDLGQENRPQVGFGAL